VAQVIQLSVSGSWEPLVIMRMFVWSSEVSYSYINSTPFFRLKIISTNVKTHIPHFHSLFYGHENVSKTERAGLRSSKNDNVPLSIKYPNATIIGGAHVQYS
jgi:hypothetical protein